MTDGGGAYRMSGGLTLSGFYGMTVIGAAVYFIRHSNTLWAGLLAVVKAIFGQHCLCTRC